jgi:hypothetical protein
MYEFGYHAQMSTCIEDAKDGNVERLKLLSIKSELLLKCAFVGRWRMSELRQNRFRGKFVKTIGTCNFKCVELFTS